VSRKPHTFSFQKIKKNEVGLRINLDDSFKADSELSVAKIDKMRTNGYWHDTPPENLKKGTGFFESTVEAQGKANIEFTFVGSKTLQIEEVSFLGGGFYADALSQSRGISVYVGDLFGKLEFCGEMDAEKEYNTGELIHIKCKKPL